MASVVLMCAYYYLSLLGVNAIAPTKVLLLISLLLSIVYLFFNRSESMVERLYLRPKLLLIIALVLLFTFITREVSLLVPMLFALMFVDDYRKLAMYLFTSSGIMFVVTLVLGLAFPDLGRDTVDKSYSIISIFGNSARSLGFPNSNQPLLYFTAIAMNGAFLFTTPRQRKLFGVIMLAIATVLFSLTLSLTGYICVIVFLGVYMVVTVLTFVLSVNFGNNDGNFINESMSKRPYLWNLRVSNGAYSNIIGNVDKYDVTINNEIGYTLDNQYLLILARYGWVAFLVFLYMLFLRTDLVRNRAILAGIFVLSMYFMSESILFTLPLSIVPVVMIGSKLATQYRAKGDYE
ncbi:hypothetical protein B7Y92_00435 [Candidatus Saccharibacteria bacterium 32-50-13]|nr:MAG: hypothetical protein B7Y92_00435 [Candidatus Saccharibacteria bacterium 32-50-13]